MANDYRTPKAGDAFERKGKFLVVCSGAGKCDFVTQTLHVKTADGTQDKEMAYCRSDKCEQDNCPVADSKCFCMLFRTKKSDTPPVRPKWEPVPDDPLTAEGHAYCPYDTDKYHYECFCVYEAAGKVDRPPDAPEPGTTYKIHGVKYLICGKGDCDASEPGDDVKHVRCTERVTCPDTSAPKELQCHCQLFRVGKAGSGESKEWEPDPEDHEFVDGKQKYPRDDKKYFYDCYCIRKTG